MTATHYAERVTSGPRGALIRAQAWLDERGKPAWIAAMVLGFVFVWPVGLGLLAYMIWSKRMFNSNCQNRRRMGHHRSTGNSAFDAYRDETLRRLQDEQEAFSAFVRRLSEAKDKAEFDQFMAERAAPQTSGSA